MQSDAGAAGFSGHDAGAGAAPSPLGSGGEAGALLRAVDWAATPLGPVAAWPQSLKTTVAMLLASRFPMVLFWGPELIQFYNDGYRPSLGSDGKHPRALGQRAEECWVEVWDVIKPQIDQVMTTGVATWHEDDLVPIFRNGILEEVYWTYTYGPVRDESGAVGGVLVVVSETTKQVVAARRLRLLRDLAEATHGATDVPAAARLVLRRLAEDPTDVPYALLYLPTPAGDGDGDGDRLTLVDSVGLADHPAARPTVVRTGADGDGSDGDGSGAGVGAGAGSTWPLAAVLAARRADVVDAGARFGPLPGTPWPEPSTTAVLLPLTAADGAAPLGVLVAGTSPRAPLDADYRQFLDMVAAEVATALGYARADEEERGADAAERRRLHALFEQTPAAVAVVRGPDHVYELANARYQALFNRTAAQLLGRPVRDVFPEVGGQGIYDAFDHAFASGEAFVAHEFPARFDRSGTGVLEQGFFDYTLQPIRDRQGRVDGLMILAFEVTALVEAKERLELAQSGGQIGAFEWKIPENVNLWSPELERIYGVPPGSFGGTFEAWRATVHPDDVDPTERRLAEALAAKAPEFEAEWRIVRPDRTQRDIYAKARFYYDAAGAPQRMLGINMDVTQRKRLERLKDDFLGVASHELKTPVTSLKGYAQVLRHRFRTAGDEASAAFVAKMDAQLTKLTTLIEDLLDVTKIDAGAFRLGEEAFGFDAVVDEVVEEARQTLRRRIRRHGWSGATLIGDRERTGQVVANLLSNAIKFSPPAEEIVVTVEGDATDVVACVADRGAGIPPEKQAHIFDRFARVAGPREDTYPGLGIGLHISAEIVRRQGGRIWVESREGEGATFCFRLPLPVPDGAGSDAGTTTATATATATAAGVGAAGAAGEPGEPGDTVPRRDA